MSHDPDFVLYMSLTLSKILDEIGINEDVVIRTRRAWLLRESLTTVSHRIKGFENTNYIFGSVTEGSTIPWLRSDNDYLIFDDNIEVVCDLKDCTQGKEYFVMSKLDATLPGYCLLSLFDDKRFLIPHITSIPAFWKANDGEEYELHGPAFSSRARTTYCGQDYVYAYYCKTWPNDAKKWLIGGTLEQWPSTEMKLFAEQSGCFAVAVGSKGSKMEMFEYRISTALAERCLMFSLNITQLRCYILMKIILKTLKSSKTNENVISSYICKNVLFHCVRHTPSTLWKEYKLLDCLTLCLSSLQYCVLIGNCPHFIIHDNNLLLGRISSHFRTELIKDIGSILATCGFILVSMIYNTVEITLEIEMIPNSLTSLTRVWELTHGMLLRDTGKTVQDFYMLTLFEVKYEKNDVAINFLYWCVFRLVGIHRLGSRLERLACRLLAAELSSTIGSLLASRGLMSSAPISKVSFEWLDASLDSNVSSNRLKKASVFYCTGEMETALSIVKDVERRYDLHAVEPVCRCTTESSYPARDGFNRAAERHNENGFKYVVAYCVNFLRCEGKCMPNELYLETFRTTGAEQPLRHLKNQWLDLALVDSLTYLLFLKYKIHGRLGNKAEQDQALKDLIRAIYFEPNLGHRETGLNLVGQIMVEKGKLFTALRFFLLSHEVQPQFNAAKIHICTVLATIVKRSVCMFCGKDTICAKTVDKNKNISEYR